MDIRRTIKHRIRKAIGREIPDKRLYVSLVSRSMLKITGHRIGLSQSEAGDLFLKLGLASFRGREQGELRQVIENLVGTDYLIKFRESGVTGVGFQPRPNTKEDLV